jgi:hypothetical protein
MPKFILRNVCHRPGLFAIVWTLSSQNAVAAVLSFITPHVVEFMRNAYSSLSVSVPQMAASCLHQARGADPQRWAYRSVAAVGAASLSASTGISICDCRPHFSRSSHYSGAPASDVWRRRKYFGHYAKSLPGDVNNRSALQESGRVGGEFLKIRQEIWTEIDNDGASINCAFPDHVLPQET